MSLSQTNNNTQGAIAAEQQQHQQHDTRKASNSSVNQQQQLPATNDNNKQNSTTNSGSQARPKFAALAATAYLRQTNPSMASVAQLEPIRKQTARSVRPNLRRQVMVATSESLSPCAPIELAGVLPMRTGGHTIVVPPKRPARLPARYGPNLINVVEGAVDSSNATGAAHAPSNLGSPNPSAVVNSSGAKPNRYSWAQMQQWQEATAQKAAAAATSDPSHPHHHNHHHFSSPFSTAASRVLVVNPMQIVNLSEHTKSRLIKFIEAVKRFSEKWFSHVLLLLFLALYACFGAYVFISFEAPSEQWEKQLIIDTRLKIINDSWYESRELAIGRDRFLELFRQKFEDYERLLNRACASGMTSSSLDNQWTFWNAIFYSMTVFTTIGYGHLTPITFAGRVATMVYAIFGIPILLMVLADLGKLLTRIIKYAFKQFRYLFNKLLRRKRAIRTRKLISDNTNQYICVARNAVERGFATYIQQPCERRMPQALRSVAANGFSLRRHNNHQHQRPNDAGDAETGAAAASPPISCCAESTQLNTDNNNPSDDNNNNNDEKSGTRKSSHTTDVIVTPGKQTKPVSPTINHKGSSSTTSAHNHHHHQQQHHSHAHHSSQRAAGSKRKGSASMNAGGSAIVVAASASTSIPANKKQQQQEPANNGGNNEVRTGEEINLQNIGNVKKDTSSDDKSSIQQPHKIINQQVELDVEVLEDSNNNNGNQKGVLDQEQMGPDDGVEDEDEEEEDEDDFDIPVSFALFLLVTYMMFGAVVFSIWEGWNFFDSLYFVFISMSTIGFGDLVPQHPKRMIGTFIYLLFGLALTSMCINVVQEKIHATFLRAKMQIGEKMGLDLEQIMADDYYHDDGSMLECETSDGDAHGDCDGSISVAVSQHSSGGGGHLDCSCDHPVPPHSQTCQIHSHTHSQLQQQQQHGEQSTSGNSKIGHHNSLDHGHRLSKSRDSLKSPQKKRSVTGLPGHNNSSSNSSGSLRRKSSSHKKSISRQATPNPSSPTTPHPATLHPVGQQQLQQSGPKPELELRRTEHFLIAKDMPSINQPVKLSDKGICEPLRSTTQRQSMIDINNNNNNNKPELPSLVSHPPTTGRRSISKSISTDFRSTLAAGKSNSTRPEEGNYYSSRPGVRSAGSSRRSSVSQELNQLDDLIVALSRSPANSERFGPLLGIPSSRRASRSHSPSTMLMKNSSSPGGSVRYNNIKHSNNSSSNNNRRGTSMTLRPTHHQKYDGMDRKKYSLVPMGNMLPSVEVQLASSPSPSNINDRNESHKQTKTTTTPNHYV